MITPTCQEGLVPMKHQNIKLNSINNLGIIQERKNKWTAVDNSRTRTEEPKSNAEFTEVNKRVNDRIGGDKWKYLEGLATTEEQAVREENMRELYYAIKKLSGTKYGKPDIPVKGKMASNHLGSEAAELIGKAFLKEFLNRPVPLSSLDTEATQTNLLMDYIVPILEINKAIQKTKNVKAAEPNSMSAEALKSDMVVTTKLSHVPFTKTR